MDVNNHAFPINVPEHLRASLSKENTSPWKQVIMWLRTLIDFGCSLLSMCY